MICLRPRHAHPPLSFFLVFPFLPPSFRSPSPLRYVAQRNDEEGNARHTDGRYRQTYVILEPGETGGLSGLGGAAAAAAAATAGAPNAATQREVLFEFGTWCYAGKIELGVNALSKKDLPHIVPVLQLQQSNLKYCCRGSQVPSRSRFYPALRASRIAASFLEQELCDDDTLRTLANLASSPVYSWINDAASGETSMHGCQPYFELAMRQTARRHADFEGIEFVASKVRWVVRRYVCDGRCRRNAVGMRARGSTLSPLQLTPSLSLSLSRSLCIHPSVRLRQHYMRSIILYLLWYNGSFYATIADAELQQHPLLDTRFPDVSGENNKGILLHTYATDEVEDYTKLMLWQGKKPKAVAAAKPAKKKAAAASSSKVAERPSSGGGASSSDAQGGSGSSSSSGGAVANAQATFRAEAARQGQAATKVGGGSAAKVDGEVPMRRRENPAPRSASAAPASKQPSRRDGDRALDDLIGDLDDSDGDGSASFVPTARASHHLAPMRSLGGASVGPSVSAPSFV